MNEEKPEWRKVMDAYHHRYSQDAAELVTQLRELGFNVESIGGLFNQKLNYEKAITLLVQWLPLMKNPVVKEDIVRALSVKWAKKTSAPYLLISEFEMAYDPTGSGLRWAIGNALEVLANDQISDDMIRLAADKKYGRSRQMLVLGLGKLKNNPRIVDVLIDLLQDEDVIAHAIDALGKLRASKARPHIERLLDHPRQLVRKEAKKALEKINKA